VTALAASASASDREREAQIVLARWRLNPVEMVVNEFGAAPDPEQLEALVAFPGLRRFALKAAKGSGKTCLLAWLIWNFFVTRPFANIPVTSITEGNLRDGLWKELGKWYERSEYLKANVQLGAERIYPRGVNPDNWFISARKWSRTADPEQQELTLAGVHDDYVFFVLDEASGIPDAVANTADAVLASGKDCKLGLAGNATNASGPLYRAFTRERELWDLLISITADPNDPKRTNRVSRQWALDQIARYGIRNPWVMTNVFAEFPTTLTEGVLSLADVLDAYGRDAAIDGTPLVRAPRSLGLDVARRGRARNVLVFREGDFVVRHEAWQQPRLDLTADLAMEHARSFLGGGKKGPPWHGKIFVDDLGAGGGVTDLLIRGGYPVEPVNACEGVDSEFFVNQRSAIAGLLRDRFQAGRISLPRSFGDDGFEAEATNLKFRFDTAGRRKLEDKDEFIGRFGASPDSWDSLALAWADELVPCAAGASGDDTEPASRERLNPRGEGTVADDPEEQAWARRRVSLRMAR